MSKKVASDETSVENVAIKTRPMNIVDDFSLLCSNEWLDAKTLIDESLTGQIDESDKVTFLCEILMVHNVYFEFNYIPKLLLELYWFWPCIFFAAIFQFGLHIANITTVGTAGPQYKILY